MIRHRKPFFAPILLAAAVALPSPAQAFSLSSGWFNWFGRLSVFAYCNPQGFCVEKGEK